MAWLDRVRSLLPARSRRAESVRALPAVWSARDELERAIDRVFERMWEEVTRGFPFGGSPGVDVFRAFDSLLPPVDVEETDDAWTIRVDVPGFEAKEVEVLASRDGLTIEGVHREERAEGQAAGERRLHLQLPLPEGADVARASAGLRNGVLTIRIPKTEEARQRVRRIPVSG